VKVYKEIIIFDDYRYITYPNQYGPSAAIFWKSPRVGTIPSFQVANQVKINGPSKQNYGK